jgi:hypothetical protein
MPGGRPISGADVLAVARLAGTPAVDAAALAEAVAPSDEFGSYEDLVAACPPDRVGMAPGAHAALFAPLFGEFE